MSTIAVVRKNGIAAIAADTLTRWGDIKEKAAYIANKQKILKVGDSYLGVVGPSNGIQILADYFERMKRPPKFSTPRELFTEWNRIHAALKKNYFIRPEEHEDDSFESSRMDVLIANPQGIFGMDAFRYVQVFKKYYAYGSGNRFALGAMHAVYDDPKLSAEEVAKIGVEAAAEFDDGTEAPIDVFTVRLRKG
jgi:ATP-dependent protease HslVU (ClpYQ) peptidase subunit